MKKILSFLIILSLSFGSLIVKAEVAEMSDPVFDNAYEFLKALGIYQNDEMNPDQTVTRVEFSKILTDILELSEAESEDISDSVLDTSFLTEKGWLWIADANSALDATFDQNATHFSDVSADFEAYSSIQITSALGLLSGEDGKFRPFENLIGMEAIIAAVKLTGGDITIPHKTDSAYIAKAKTMRLLNNLITKDYQKPLRFRDITVLLYNTMNAQVYVLSSIENNVAKYETKKDYYLMSLLYDVYVVKGTVSATEYANFEDYALAGRGCVNIGGEEYKLSTDTDDLFGYYVKLYYKEDVNYQTPPVVYYELLHNQYETVVIDSDDINDFQNHTLSYNVGDKSRTVKITSSAAVVYNGVLITDYEDDMMAPLNGNIELVDCNKDGNYEVVKVWRYRTIVVDSVDYDNKILYGSDGDVGVLSIEDGYYQVFFADGTEVEFSTIGKDNVVSVASTASVQDIQRHKLVISSKRVSGKVTGIVQTDKKVLIDNIPYDIAPSFSLENISLGANTTVFLDFCNKIVKTNDYLPKTGKYGYLRKLDQIGSKLSGVYGVRIFETDGKFRNYVLENRVIFNGTMIKAKEVHKMLIDDSGETMYQVIQYWINDDGKLEELCTAGGKDGAFCKMDTSVLGGQELTYRNDALLSYANKGFAAFLNTSDGFTYFAIPSDRSNEDKYGCSHSLIYEQKYTFDEMYIKNKDSKFVDIVVQLDADVPVQFVTTSAKPYMMISKISQIIRDDVTGYAIYGYDLSNSVKYLCFDENLMAQCEELHVGDIIRVMTDSISGEITYIKRFYDGEKCAMEDGKSVYGDILHPYEAYNGFAVRDSDSRQFLILHQYEYVDGLPNLSTPYVAKAERTVKYPPRVILFNRTQNKVKIGNKLDIICSTDPQIASQVVVCSYYENSQVVFVID